MKAQTCRRHVKTRAEESFSKRQNFSRSRYTAFSRRRRRRLSRKAQRNHAWWNSETWGRPRAREKQKRSDCLAWMATAQQCKRRRRRWDTGGLTANNNHAGGVEDLRNHAVVESQRQKKREGSDSRPRCCNVPRP